MTYIVKVRYVGSDWADLMADMCSWLERRQIDAEEFDYSLAGLGIAFRVGLPGEDQAATFAEAFGGRLHSVDLRKAAAQRTMAGDDADPSLPRGATPSDDATPERVQPISKAPQAFVSLMITHQQKAGLRARGYSDDQIRAMKPEEAHKVLGLIK